MRRLLTTLFILLVVLVAGVAALVALINPNDFRNYMVTKVEQRSGYQLRIDGPLRWHAWPQLSILAGRMTLTAPGAKTAVVSAENMRLDVALLPLLSHQLLVKQVMLKGAVINLTPDSEKQRPKNAPIAPAGQPESVNDSEWSWDIANLQVADSLVIWQRDANEQINLRDVNLSMEQHGNSQANIDFSSRISRDQRDVQLAVSGKADISQFPRQLSAELDKFSYQLHGVGLPESGISGEGSLSVAYSRADQQLAISQLRLSANDSSLTGSASADLGNDRPQYRLDLHAQTLNLDALTGFTAVTDDDDTPSAPRPATARPVIAERINPPPALHEFNGQLTLAADNVIYRGLAISGLQLQADNQGGRLALTTLHGKLGEGEFSLPGVIDLTGSQPWFQLQATLKRIALAPLLQAFALPQTLTGLLSAQGTLSGHRLTAADFRQHWQGKADLALDRARLDGLNIQQLIQRAVARNSGNIDADQRTERYTEVEQLTAAATLQNGKLTLANLAGSSDLLSLNGSGDLDLLGRQCEVSLNIRVLKGWKGDAALIEALTSTDIPLKIYGPWASLSYQLRVDQVLRNRLQDELKRRLNEWKRKNPDSSQNKNVGELIEKL
ncbi:outer membrane assembly protein AsmA [Biostraticola tofi]|uniref:AsmA protein n=1 Tax=Biostraticola tofi TaxID=466109 RepID=A0A4R3Z4U0_9GAMM|nr:outer membrane assembly protein AsmA [Biostraticola tofi]TCW00217.1 AsmA protein [Biostraticola tofi]